MEYVEDTDTQSSLFSPFSYFFSILETYGWHILITSVILTYIYHKVVKEHVDTYMKKRDEAEYAAKYHKNPDLLNIRVEAQQKLADKLQEKYKRDAEEYQRKLAEREERKKEELAAKLTGELPQKLGNGSEDSKKKSFRPEYHPLMGSGSGSNYRPPKKSKCGGGGCGK